MRLAFFSSQSAGDPGFRITAKSCCLLLRRARKLICLPNRYLSTNQQVRDLFPVYPYPEFAQRHQQSPYDLCLYQMGNNPKFHGYMDELIQTYPGVVTLHDYVTALLFHDPDSETEAGMRNMSPQCAAITGN